jgi:hypothetical protein
LHDARTRIAQVARRRRVDRDDALPNVPDPFARAAHEGATFAGPAADL